MTIKEFISRMEKHRLCGKIMYFIVDLVDRRRAPDNMVFCFGYETDQDCLERLKELQEGKIELSRRHGIPLDIDIE